MRTRIGILLLVMVLGFSGSAWMNGNMKQEAAPTASKQNTVTDMPEQPEKLSWWTLLYERPNPDQLPVKVSFWFAKNT